MKLSILLSSYNRLWCLPRAIESCRGSRYETEILVADDGSTDGTIEWLAQQRDVIRVETPCWGQTYALNAALDRATGDYVRMLDSDDWICEGAIDRQMGAAERTGADVIVGTSEVRDESGALLATKAPPPGVEDLLTIYLREMPVPHYSANLFRRDFVGSTRFLQPYPAADFAVQDDLRFLLELGLKEPTVHIDTEPATCILHHGKGRLMHQQGMRRLGSLLQFVMLYKRIMRRMIEANRLTEQRAAAAAYFLWRLADWIAREGFLKDAAEIADWAALLSPSTKPSYTPGVARLVDLFGFRGAMRLLHWRRRAAKWLRNDAAPVAGSYPAPSPEG